MSAYSVEIKGNLLTITAAIPTGNTPLQKSKSGKSEILATSGGNPPAINPEGHVLMFNGRKVFVGFNAYVK